MNMQYLKQAYIRFFILCASPFLVAYQVLGGQLTYSPPVVPPKISVNTWGEIDIEASGQIVTPLGVFELGVIAEPTRYFDGVENTLVVLIDDEECWYDLNGQDFELDLQPGHYE